MIKTKFHFFRRRYVAGMLLTAMIAALVSVPAPVQAQVRPIYDLGASGLGQKLRRLQTIASAMHTAAHPDDEDSGLMAYLARKDQARTAYLSLNRGEGGQNVIGDELFEPLGIIRTEELLQARRLDGGEQFFTRSMDYGFSKTLAEATRMWNEREILGDMVRAIRLYRPLVVISRFSGTTADGHGHHQMAGYLTPLAFKAAGDAKEFPEHIKEGLHPWQPLKFYVSQGFAANPANQPTLFLNTGQYDHLIGRSYFEIAMEGRSQHKSQEMGVLELRGPQRSGMRLVESHVSKVENETGVFDGIDTTITGIATLVPNHSPEFKELLVELQATADKAVREYNIYKPEALVPVLARGYELADKAAWSIRDPHAKAFLEWKKQDFADALQAAAGVVVDALASTDMVNPGRSVNVGVRVFAANEGLLKVNKTELVLPSDWSAVSIEELAAPPTTSFRPRTEIATSAAFFRVNVPDNARPTQPYWLYSPRTGASFDWSSVDAASKNQSFSEPLVRARVSIEIGGREIIVERKVEYRFADDIRGEIRRPVNVVPDVTVGLESDLLIAPASKESRTYRVVTTVENNSPGEIAGTAGLNVPASWRVSPAEQQFKLESTGERTAFTFEVSVPANYRTGTYKLSAFAKVNGKEFAHRMQVVAYPHIQTHRVFRSSEITAHVLDLDVAPVRIGYIMGSGDKVPEAIRRLGLDVTMLGEKDLSTGDLSVYDTIVVGIRASQVRPDFVANNGRLLDFARKGGTLVVQYQQHEYVQNNLQPFPASMTGVTRGNQRISNLRVTDENARVNVLVPDHPIFNYPNKIVDGDWDNWVQERNLYCFTTFDERYVPLLESRDEGEDENKGGMLYARLGKGHYLYTSYSWFRQLPAGTPGAYRIFANILSLPKAESK